MLLGKGSTNTILTTDDVQQLLASAYDDLLAGAGLDPARSRILVIIPDGTRTAPIPQMFRLLYEQLGHRVAQLDYLIALGTHPPMSQDAIDHLVGVTAVQRANEEGYYIKTPYIDHLVGVTATERAERYPNVRIFNHDWANPQMLQTIGVISRREASELTDGLLTDDVPVTNDEAGLTNHSSVPTRSSGSPNRPIGVWSIMVCPRAVKAPFCASIIKKRFCSVKKKPGEIAFTRI